MSAPTIVQSVRPPSLLADDDIEEETIFTEKNLPDFSFPIFEEVRRQGKLCDVTLVVGDVRFSAHRVVLAATVPYFYGMSFQIYNNPCKIIRFRFFLAMFTHDMVESVGVVSVCECLCIKFVFSLQNQREISMLGIDAETLGALINYAYTGRVKITNLNVQSLFVGASFLQLSRISEACGQFLVKRLHVSNVLSIRQFGQALGDQIVMKAADKYIQKNFLSIRQTEEFLNLSLEDLIDILRRDELYVVSEEQIFESALIWVQKDADSRRALMADLLACVRLPLLKPHYITDRVRNGSI